MMRLLQSNSFIASSAIVHFFAKPVFVDIKNNQMIDEEEKIQSKITKKTKAIMLFI